MFTVTTFAGFGPNGTRVPLNTLDDLAKLMIKEHWSPATFSHDYRQLANFESLRHAVLDYDGGLALAKAQSVFASFACIIAPTRHHQMQKGNQPACDRFRVVLELTRPITSAEEFKTFYAELLLMFPGADPATSDASRFWLASNAVDTVHTTGKQLDVDALLAQGQNRTHTSSQATKTVGTHAPSATTTDFIIRGAPAGQWNDSLFAAACDLRDCDYSEGEAIQALQAPTRLNGNKGTLDAHDLSTIKSAFKRSRRARGSKRSRITFADLCDWVRAEYPTLKTDVRSGEVYSNGKVLRLDSEALVVKYDLSSQGNDAPTEEVVEAFVHVGAQQGFNPVTSYLDALKWDGSPRLEAVPTTILRTQADTLTSAYFAKWAISAVARAYKPGCKVDTVLVLQGLQGCGKSTFVKTMAVDWFSDTSISLDNKDSYLALARNWIIEWSELDSLTRTKNQSSIRAFISSAEDHFRRPYGKDISVAPRSSVFVGTTNDTEFLNDPTGSRRYMVISGITSIELVQLAHDRDQLWAEAVTRYKNGDLWALTKAEEQLQQERNEDCQVTDIWMEQIDAFVKGKTRTTSAAVLKELGIDVGARHSGHSARVAACLRRLGWEPKKHRGDRSWQKIPSSGTQSLLNLPPSGPPVVPNPATQPTSTGAPSQAGRDPGPRTEEAK